MNCQDHIYRYPLYYEIGFAREDKDLDREVEFILDCYQRSSGKKKEQLSVLDNGMGTGNYLQKFLEKRHYGVGYDLSPQMVDYAKKKLEVTGNNFSVFTGDLKDFSTAHGFDLAICLNGSFQYLMKVQEVKKHLKCVHKALGEEGIYIVSLPWPGIFLENPPGKIDAQWTNIRGDIKVEVNWTYEQGEIDWENQTFSGLAKIKVTDGEDNLDLKMKYNYRLFFIQELKAIAELTGLFSPKGVFTEEDLTGRPVTMKVALQKK